MTVGAVFFAQNNGAIDYVKLANFAAIRVKEFLDIPVSIVTDSPDWLNKSCPNHPFENIIVVPEEESYKKEFYDGSLTSKPYNWKNLSRPKIYEITPYEKTLVLDSDYIINSNILKIALDRDVEFQIYKKSFDLSTWRDPAPFTRINSYSIPFYWATVFIFEKSPVSEAFFDLVNYIKINWVYFRMLYNIDPPMFRNDFAFSIAIHIMNGKTNGGFATELPGKMTYSLDRDVLVSMNQTEMKFLIEKKDHLGEYILAKTNGLDVHVMNKFSLSRCVDRSTGV